MGHQYSCNSCKKMATFRYDIIIPCNITKIDEFLAKNPEYKNVCYHIIGINDNQSQATLLFCSDHDEKPKFEYTLNISENGFFGL